MAKIIKRTKKDGIKCGFPMLIIFGVVTTALCAVFYL